MEVLKEKSESKTDCKQVVNDSKNETDIDEKKQEEKSSNNSTINDKNEIQVDKENQTNKDVNEDSSIVNNVMESKSGEVNIANYYINMDNMAGNVQIGNKNKAFNGFDAKNENATKDIYNLSIADDWFKFAKDKKFSRIFSFSILICVFEWIPINYLDDLINKVQFRLPKINSDDDYEKIKYEDALLSLDEMVQTIGAERVEIEVSSKSGKVMTNGVILPNREKALKNLWTMYTNLREPINNFLLSLLDESDDLIYKKTIQAFVSLIKLDFSFGQDTIINLLSVTGNLYALSFVFQNLYYEKCSIRNIEYLLKKWSKHKRMWIVTMLCTIHSDYQGDLKKLVSTRLVLDNLSYNNLNLKFIGNSLVFSKELRNNVINVLYEYSQEPDNLQKVARLYNILIYHAYIMVTRKNPYLPLVVCDDDEQLQKLSKIIKTILDWVNHRNLAFDLLKIYLKEYDEYSLEIPYYMKRYFIKMAFFGRTYFDIVQKYLFNCQSNSSSQLNEYLSSILQKTLIERK